MRSSRLSNLLLEIDCKKSPRHEIWPTEIFDIDIGTFNVQAPKVPLCNIDNVCKSLDEQVTKNLVQENLRTALKLLTFQLEELNSTTWDHKRIPQSSMKLKQIHQLQDSGIVKEISNPMELSRCQGFALCHRVLELIKSRFRAIADTIVSNVMLPSLQPPLFQSLNSLRRRIYETNEPLKAVVVDFTAFFYQFHLSVTDYVFFRRGNHFFRFDRAPMGHKWMPSIAQALSQYIAMLVEQAHPNTKITFDVYLDNLVFVAPDSICTSIKEVLETILKDFNITHNGIQIAKEFTHRGITFDLHAKTVCMKSSFVEKMKDRIHYLQSHSPTVEQAESLLGMCAWMHSIYPFTDLQPWYSLLAKSIASNSPPTQKELEPLCEVILLHIDKSWKMHEIIEQKPLQYVLFTDASEHHWGAVLLTWGSRMQVIRGSFASNHLGLPIHELEALALLNALQNFDLRDTHVHIVVDNTAVLYAVQKGRSSSTSFHAVLTNIKRKIRENLLTVSLCYIPSSLNLADEPSRMKEIQPNKIKWILGYWGGVG